MRTLLLKWLLGKDVTIFIEEKGSGIYEVEVADSKNRKKLLVCEAKKITSIRYHLIEFRPF